MFKSKFLQLIWSINGVVLFVGIIIGLAYIISEIINSNNNDNYEYRKGAIIEKNNEGKKIIDQGKQHLIYQTPIKISDTKYYYSLVNVVDKKFPDQILDDAKRANYFSLNILGGTVNIVFLKEDESEVYSLLEGVNYISEIDMPPEVYLADAQEDKQNHITYRIAKKDTDADGRINDKDKSAYYISDLTGKNLKQITPDSLNLDKLFSEGNLLFFEEVVRKLARDEKGDLLKIRYLYSYNVESGEFKKLNKLQAEFDKLQKVYNN